MNDIEELLKRAKALLDRLDRILPGYDAKLPTGDSLAWRWQISTLKIAIQTLFVFV